MNINFYGNCRAGDVGKMFESSFYVQIMVSAVPVKVSYILLTLASVAKIDIATFATILSNKIK